MARPLEPQLGGALTLLQRLGGAEIPLAVRGELGQLTVGGPVAVRGVDRAGDLHDQHSGALEMVEFDAVHRPPRDHQVVVMVEPEAPELRVERPCPAVDEEHVIGRAVDEEGLLLPLRDEQPDPDVVVDEQPLPPGDGVAMGGEAEPLEEGVLVDLLVLHGDVVPIALDDVLDGLRHVPVIEQGRGAGEALPAEQLLVGRGALDRKALMALPGQLTQPHVGPHRATVAGAGEGGGCHGTPSAHVFVCRVVCRKRSVFMTRLNGSRRGTVTGWLAAGMSLTACSSSAPTPSPTSDPLPMWSAFPAAGVTRCRVACLSGREPERRIRA